MIDPKELRIGNRLSPRRVLDPENIPLTGYSICAGHIAYSVERLNYDWEAILLNPEILERCGFESVDETTWVTRMNITLCKGDDGYYLGNLNGQPYSKNQKYLHQLQNLYFSLSGTELEINL